LVDFFLSVAGRNIHGDGIAVAGHVEKLGADDWNAAEDTQHFGRAEQDVGRESGVVLGNAFFGLKAGGLHLNTGVEGFKRLPAVIEAGDELLGGHRLYLCRSLGDGQVTSG